MPRFLEPLAQRIGVVGAIGDHPFRLLPRPAFGSRDFDFCERGFRKRNFSRRGTFQPNSQRKTATVDQYHPLRALAALGFTDCGAPFFAGAKLPSRNVSSHFSSPSPSSAPSSVRHASSHTSCSSHCFNRRQQVAGEGYLSGKKSPRRAGLQHPQNALQAGPVRRPRTARLSLRRFGSGSSGSISSHCARSTTQIASCSCKKFIKPTPHAEVPSLRPNLFMKHALGEHFDDGMRRELQEWASGKPQSVHSVILALPSIAGETFAHIQATCDARAQLAWDEISSQMGEKGFTLSKLSERGK
jgi:hypothetical protein